MNRAVNFKALFVILGAFALLATGVHFLHAYQVNRNAAALLANADFAEREGRIGDAVEELDEYLGLHPDDVDALVHFGTLLAKQAQGPKGRLRAYLILENALRRDSGRDDVRLQVARLAVPLGYLQPARDDLEFLLKSRPEDIEVLQLLGRCEFGLRDLDKARAHFHEALRLEPYRVDLTTDLVKLLLESNKRKLADGVILAMLENNADLVAAHQAAASYYRQVRTWELAEKQIKAAHELGGHDLELLLLGAEVAQVRNHPDDRRAYLQESAERYPDDPQVARELARFEFQQGHRDEALKVLQPALQKLPTNFAELWVLTNLLLDMGEAGKAELCVAQFRTIGLPWVADYVKARGVMRNGDWGEARKLLQALRGKRRMPAPAPTQVDLLLAECCSRVGNARQQLEASRHAVDGAPESPLAHRFLANALLAAGRRDEAMVEYARLAGQDSEALLVLGGLELVRILSQPPSARDWSALERALKTLTEKRKDDIRVRVLNAEMLVARNREDEARKEMSDALKANDKQFQPWLFLAALEVRHGKAAEALALLAEAEQKIGPRPEWELARLRIAQGDKAHLPARLQEIETRLARFAQNEQDRLALALADAYEALEDTAAAQRLWRQVAEHQPQNVAVRFFLLESAVQNGKADEARGLVDEIRRQEGDDGGLVSYGQATIVLAGAAPTDKSAFAEAHRLLTQAAAARPWWPNVPLLEARLYDTEGRPDKAIEKYQLARSLGETRPFLVRRLVELLRQQDRLTDAVALLQKIPTEEARMMPELERAVAQLTLQQGESLADPAPARERALELARKAVSGPAVRVWVALFSVPVMSADYRNYLWLGSMCAAADKRDQAKDAFRTACELAPSAPETWTARVRFLASIDAAGAEEVLKEARTKIAAEKLPLLLGPAYEALGKLDAAEQQFKAQASGKSPDAGSLRNLAGFYGRTGQAARAEPILRGLIDSSSHAPDTTVAWARRALALNLAQAGDYKQFNEALALVQVNMTAAPNDAEDQKTKLLVLATHPSHRREAIELFGELSKNHQAESAEVRFLLARVYEADGNWTEAQGQIARLLVEHPRNPLYLSYIVRACLRHGQPSDAEGWLDRLGKVRGLQSFEVVELRARLCHAQKNNDAAIDIVQEYARRDDAKLDQAALLLDAIEQPVAAEQVYRNYLKKNKKASATLLLAMNLARQDRVADALAICEPAWTSDAPPEAVAQACLRVLRLGKSTPSQKEKVDEWIAAALKKKPQSVPLYLIQAELRDFRGRTDEAITLYRRILQFSPTEPVALNNLAYYLAVTGGNLDEALQAVKSALEQLGPRAELLDTEALVCLKRDEPEPAIRYLQQALAQAPSPSRYFHLAQARIAAHDLEGARNAWSKALAANSGTAGLSKSDLHPLEQPAYDQVVKDLEPKENR